MALTALRQPAADDLFAQPFARLAAVDVGRVEEIEAHVERRVQHGLTFAPVSVPKLPVPRHSRLTFSPVRPR